MPIGVLSIPGIWSTIAEREKQDIANVEVRTAPIKSATATANKTVLYRNGGGARQILFNFNVNTSDGYTISDANKVTVGLYVGDTLIRELDFVEIHIRLQMQMKFPILTAL